jgi:hypothetical protein
VAVHRAEKPGRADASNAGSRTAMRRRSSRTAG